MIIYLSRPAIAGREPNPEVGTMMRRYPRIFIGPAALPLFCLAPHGVFHASRITPRAVSSYLAFSPLPVLCCQRTGGVFSVTLSVTAIFQLRCPRVLRGMPPYGVRTFLQQAASGSPAIICHRQIIYHNRLKKKLRKAAEHPKRAHPAISEGVSNRRWHRQKENRDHYERDK
jgi:hypothetical protein